MSTNKGKSQVMKPKKNRNRKGRMRLGGLPLTFTPGPAAMKKILTYEYIFGLTEAAVGAGQWNSFRLNSIYDPDYTGVGTSALGYSTYALLFSRYRVVRTRLFLRIVDATNVAGGAQTVGVICNANPTFTATVLNWAAQPFAVSRVLMGSSGQAHSMCTIDKTIDLHKIAGVTQQQFLMDQDYGATFGSNPTTSLYAHVFVHGKLSSSAEIARVEMRMVFETELSQPLASVTV